MEVVARCRLGRLVSARYPLDRFEEALAHAGAAGRRGAVKIVFDLRRAPTGRSDPSTGTTRPAIRVASKPALSLPRRRTRVLTTRPRTRKEATP